MPAHNQPAAFVEVIARVGRVDAVDFSADDMVIDRPPLYDKAAEGYTDPLPQALVLTAIVIAFGMTAFVVVLALRSYLETGVDRVDGTSDAEGDR